MLYNVKNKAHDDLRFIRATMERAASFTAVPGWGGAIMGVTAIAAALAAGRVADARWTAIWLAEAVVASATGIGAMLVKARRSRVPLGGGPARRFALAFLPPLGAGAALTVAFAAAGEWRWLPGCWLLLYGAAVTAGGALSIPVVPVLGIAVMICGLAALAAPAAGPLLMPVGFGLLQIGFGMLIGLKYGG